MNGFGLNAAAIDSAGVVAQYAFLPSSSVGITLGLGQFNAALLTGALSLSLDASGDIVKRIQLGTGTTNLAQDASGVMAKQLQLGTGTSNLGLDASGLMSALKVLPSVSAGFALDATGSLILTAGLSGVADVTLETGGYPFATLDLGNVSLETTFSVSGALSNKQFLAGGSGVTLASTGFLSVGVITEIPSGVAPIALLMSASEINAKPGLGVVDVAIGVTGELSRRLQIAGSAGLAVDMSGDLAVGLRRYMGPDLIGVLADASGDLTRGMRLGAALADTQLDATGSLSVRIAIQGSTAMALACEGALAVNATAKDIDQNTLVRPATDRTMTRTA